MLQAVVRDDGIEAMIGKRKAPRVGLHETIASSRGRNFQVHPHDVRASAVIGGEAAGERTEVKYARPRAQIAQDLNQAASILQCELPSELNRPRINAKDRKS